MLFLVRQAIPFVPRQQLGKRRAIRAAVIDELPLGDIAFLFPRPCLGIGSTLERFSEVRRALAANAHRPGGGFPAVDSHVGKPASPELVRVLAGGGLTDEDTVLRGTRPRSDAPFGAFAGTEAGHSEFLEGG